MNAEQDHLNLQETAEKVCRYMMAEHTGGSNALNPVDVNSAAWGLDIHAWDWNPGVGVTALAAYYDSCKRPEVLDYLTGWVQRNKHQARKFQHVNVMAPFAIFPEMYRWTGERYYFETAVEYGDWILKNSVRTQTGALQQGGDLTEEFWADTIFMVVLFLARLGRMTGQAVYAQQAAEQLRLHLQYLQDPQTGVLFHGYDCQKRNHKSGARWTRGNAWITVGTPLILAEIDGSVAIPAEIGERYARLAEGLLKYQASNGLWHTVMDRPAFYQETSGSAGIACGLLEGIRQGLLKPDYLPAVEKALRGVLQKITPEGAVAGVSGGTPILNTIDEYNLLSCYPTLYGQGLTLMLLAEYMALDH